MLVPLSVPFQAHTVWCVYNNIIVNNIYFNSVLNWILNNQWYHNQLWHYGHSLASPCSEDCESEWNILITHGSHRTLWGKCDGSMDRGTGSTHRPVKGQSQGTTLASHRPRPWACEEITEYVDCWVARWDENGIEVLLGVAWQIDGCVFQAFFQVEYTSLIISNAVFVIKVDVGTTFCYSIVDVPPSSGLFIQGCTVIPVGFLFATFPWFFFGVGNCWFQVGCPEGTRLVNGHLLFWNRLCSGGVPEFARSSVRIVEYSCRPDAQVSACFFMRKGFQQKDFHSGFLPWCEGPWRGSWPHSRKHPLCIGWISLRWCFSPSPPIRISRA